MFWNSTSKEIEWKPIAANSLEQTFEFINDASNDDIDKISILVNRRKYQGKFRTNLLTLYNNRCAISDTNVIEVLEASHISEHSKSKNNANLNGILLRADLHSLFDKNLILIHPTKLTIHIHPSLSNSVYKDFTNKKINDRTDNSKPSKQFLQEKWNSVDWTGSII